MKGILFAFLGGAFITLQGVANARISQDIGTWQTATITHLTGFIVTLILLIFIKENQWNNLKRVQPLYMAGGTFGAFVIFGNVTAIHHIGVTVTVSLILLAQLLFTYLVDSNGWFGMVKQQVKLHQFVGIGMMIVGVVILRF